MEKRKGIGIRALVKLRCGNLEEDNKYWIDKDKRICRFCKKGYDNMEHYVGECEIASIWFENLGKDVRERLDRCWNVILNEEKKKVLIKLWKEKDKRKEEVGAEKEES